MPSPIATAKAASFIAQRVGAVIGSPPVSTLRCRDGWPSRAPTKKWQQRQRMGTVLGRRDETYLSANVVFPTYGNAGPNSHGKKQRRGSLNNCGLRQRLDAYNVARL